MLMYGLPTKAATRHAIPLIITQCLSTRAEAEAEVAPPAGLFLTVIAELLPVSFGTALLLACCLWHAVMYWPGCVVVSRAVLGFAMRCCAMLCYAVHVLGCACLADGLITRV